MASFLRPNLLRRVGFVCDACSKQWQQRSVRRVVSTAAHAPSASGATRTSIVSRSTFPTNPRSLPRNNSLIPRRFYSVAAAPCSEPAPSGLAPLPSRRLISLSGPDAAKFLQGLITHNVAPEIQSPFYAAFLDARGRVLWDVFIWVYPDLVAKEGAWACYIEVNAGEVDAMLRHLKRHKLRSKIAIKAVEQNELGVWAVWGVQQEELRGEHLIASLPDPRGFSTTEFGLRCLFKENKAPSNLPAPVVDEREYHVRRYITGIPEGPLEIQRESALPMECNIDLSQGIDFRKGCYVGQELTIRTKHTGVVRKRILPVQLYTNTSDPSTVDINWPASLIPDAGADIKQLDENGSVKKGRATGKFIAGIGNVGLALCRLEMMTSMRISAEGGSWKPGVEFGIQKGDGSESEGEGELIKVRAVVTQDFRERERDVWDKARTRV